MRGDDLLPDFFTSYCIVAGDEALTDKQIHDRDVQWLTESDGGCYFFFF